MNDDTFTLTPLELETLLWALEGADDMLPGVYANTAHDLTCRFDEAIATNHEKGAA